MLPAHTSQRKAVHRPNVLIAHLVEGVRQRYGYRRPLTTHLSQPKTIYASCWANGQDDANHVQAWAMAGTLTAIKEDTITRQ